jgi:hypothetical protein
MDFGVRMSFEAAGNARFASLFGRNRDSASQSARLEWR